MSDEPKLAPCPFCGSEAEIIYIQHGDNAGGSCVCCTRCSASSNVEFGRKENFVSNWNRRVPAPAVPDDVAEPWRTMLRQAEDDLRKAHATIEAQAAELARLREVLENEAYEFSERHEVSGFYVARRIRAALTQPTGEPRINWRDDPNAIVEDDEMDVRGGPDCA